ncbi:MAG: threonine synthase [Bacteroidia bacterium]|nr:threonine synthase [Bacteroidia bacterium]
MNYYSLNKRSPIVDFKEATIRGQAPDKGLYFPESIPQLDSEFIQQLQNLSNEEIAFHVIKPYIGKTIPDDRLFEIVNDTLNFPIPLIQVNENIFSLELFHGPTLAFKDVGARFMSRCLGYFIKNNDRKVTVLVATSGDTGGAVANGFLNIDGVEVVILYPSGKVSTVQEKQLTTLGGNIHALEISGTFDDCQQMVKQAFIDEEINKKLFLTSANSINVARWLPQQFYYFFAYKQWKFKDQLPVISVPSGNFGNICAGLLAHHSGLPAAHFIAACNVNDTVTRYLQTSSGDSDLIPQPAIATISNAMDVGNPSNFIRILELFHHRFPELTSKLSSYSISDEETKATIQQVFQKYDYTLDPHGAVGYLSLERYLNTHPESKGIFLETAHPVKFPEAVEGATGKIIEIPLAMQSIMKKQKNSINMKAGYNHLKDYLLNK